ncbi:hypothetical protein FGRMN_917 [Fusarium graminum]|nr:hypothetical protein FGRMN_917 [Fusarium graminum]
MTTTTAATTPEEPDLTDLDLFLRDYLAPREGGLPGSQATVAELDFAERDSPIKGEDIAPGPWPGVVSSNSVEDEDSAAVVGGTSSPPPVSRLRRFARRLRRLFSFSPS